MSVGVFMSSPEVMFSDLVSYELARDMADVANTAHTVMQEAEAALNTAQLIEKADVSGVALEVGSLAVLAERHRVAGNSFVHAYNIVPNFRTEVQDGAVNSDSTAPETIDPETLTPEEQAYKETALERLKESFGSYSGVMDAMNRTRKSKEKLRVVTEAEAKVALEVVLTPTQIRAEIAQIAEFSTNPEANGPEAGFDTVFVPNADLTAKDETAVATYLQNRLQAYKGTDGAHLHELLHNQGTAHKATGVGLDVVVVRAPRHLNIRAGNVATQKTAVEAHNNNLDKDYKLVMADDTIAMAHIALLIDTGAIDTTNPNYDNKRFWSTYYKNVLATPFGGCVPSIAVDADGRFSRAWGHISNDFPSRALVVPKA